GQVGDGGVLGLARTVRHDGGVARTVGHIGGVQRFGQGADLVHLDQDGVSQTFADAGGQTARVGHEQVVADQLHPVAQTVRQQLPADEVVFGAAALDRGDREALDQVGQVVD